ncbi:unnamed protein product [Ambrosiozyma monospora]|uniref:Unnamed protein product n=1 Tax=Ambrosiozyma monospora TaxID=43982 RepID=A0A9W6Z0Y9_AMBMO|nr:unnamed protein product [Ambrosiozyma monospora]
MPNASSILNGVKNFFLVIVFGIDDRATHVTDDDLSSFSDEQESDGAPVEKKSPLGYEVTHTAAFYLILQGVIGTGIFATPASILKSMGSVGATYILWIVGFLVTLCLIFMYIEYVTYFRRRSGGDVVYLEQAYPKPQFLVPVSYAAVTVILSFATSSASAFATYVFKAADYEPTNWESRGLSVAPLILAAVITGINTKFAMRLNSLLGFAKIVFIFFIAFSGFAALSGTTKAPKNHDIFKNTWEGTTTDGNSISNAIMKVVFAYGGTGYAFGVVAETNPKNTIKTFKYFVPATLFVIFLLYILCVTAYYAGIQDIKTIKSSGSLVAAVYFEKIFETQAAVRAMCAFVAISAFGHLLTVYISHSRALRECGRQGVLPFPRLWTSVKPWGTPLFPILVTLIVNLIVLLAPPPGDAYNFIVDLGSYSGYIFNLLLVIGIFKLRKDRKSKGLGFREFKCPTPLLVIVFLWALFILVMAFVPPKGTLIGSDVSFFYATYPLTTFGLFALCLIYYAVWSQVLPRVGNYQYRINEYSLPNGEVGHTVVKVKNGELEKWDAEHKLIKGLHGGFDDELETEVRLVEKELSNHSASSYSSAEKKEGNTTTHVR